MALALTAREKKLLLACVGSLVLVGGMLGANEFLNRRREALEHALAFLADGALVVGASHGLNATATADFQDGIFLGLSYVDGTPDWSLSFTSGSFDSSDAYLHYSVPSGVESSGAYVVKDAASAVPEPSAWALCTAGLLGLLGWRRRCPTPASHSRSPACSSAARSSKTKGGIAPGAALLGVGIGAIGASAVLFGLDYKQTRDGAQRATATVAMRF